jgi:hypothetical protein
MKPFISIYISDVTMVKKVDEHGKHQQIMPLKIDTIF